LLNGFRQDTLRLTEREAFSYGGEGVPAMMITPDRLTSLFRPRSVALVGASDKSTFSLIAYRNLVEFGFADRTYLVNRRGADTHGQPTVPSCAQIGAPSTWRTDGASGRDARRARRRRRRGDPQRGRALVRLRRGGGRRAGPRRPSSPPAPSRSAWCCSPQPPGVRQPHRGRAGLLDPRLRVSRGPVALLSQSGASSAAMIDFAAMAGVGLSYLVTLGNEAMITAGHVLDFLVDRPGHAGGGDLHGDRARPGRLPPRRPAGRRGGQGHRGAQGREQRAVRPHRGRAHRRARRHDKVIDAVFADLGVIRVDSIEDMLITAGAAAALGRLDRPGIGIVSISGGACDIVADRAEELGADLPELAGEPREALAAVMPGFGTVQNRST